MEGLTVNFLNSARTALIACADRDMLLSFCDYLKSQGQSVEETNYTTPKELSQKLTALTEGGSGNALLAVRCESYSALRSVYFYIPEALKSDIGVFVLKGHLSGVKLECELGEMQGMYILFDCGEGKFKERA